MKLYEVIARTPALLQSLLAVWEASVRATHGFLPEAEIERIKAYVLQALGGVEHLVVVEEHSGELLGFMGVDSERLEMLFLAPAARGKGLGRRLVEYGIRNYALQETTVNEQNPQAVGFYEHMGFAVYRRTPTDEQGGPYPILYMCRK